MKLILLFLLFPFIVFAQSDTIKIENNIIEQIGPNMYKFSNATSTNPGLATPAQITLQLKTAERVSALENVTKLVPINNINQPTYTLSMSDAGTVIVCNSACVISFASGLPVGFTCRVVMSQGAVSFSGNTASTFGWKRIQTQNGYCDVLHLGGNKFQLSGNLKQ